MYDRNKDTCKRIRQRKEIVRRSKGYRIGQLVKVYSLLKTKFEAAGIMIEKGIEICTDAEISSQHKR